LRRRRLFPPDWPGFDGQALGAESAAAEQELRETTYAPGVPTIDVLVFGRRNWGKSQLIVRLVNSLRARVPLAYDLSEREIRNQRELEQRRNDLTAQMGATLVPEHFVTLWSPYEDGALAREPAWRWWDAAALCAAALLPVASAGVAVARGAALGPSLLVPIATVLAGVGLALARAWRRFTHRPRPAPGVELVLWDVPGEFIWRSQGDAADDRARGSATPQNRAARFFSELLARRAEIGAATFAPILIANPLELLAPLDGEAGVPIEVRKRELCARLPGDAGRRLTPEQWLNPNAQHLYRLASWIDGWVERQEPGVRARSLLAVINYWNVASDLLARGDGVRFVHLRLGDADHLLHLDQLSHVAEGLAAVCRGLDVEVLRTDAAATRRLDLESGPDADGWHRCEAAYFDEEVGPLSDAAPEARGRLANPGSERDVVTRWLLGYYAEAVARAAASAGVERSPARRDAGEADTPVEHEVDAVPAHGPLPSHPEIALEPRSRRSRAVGAERAESTPGRPLERVGAGSHGTPRTGFYASRGDIRPDRLLRLRDLPPSPPRTPRSSTDASASAVRAVEGTAQETERDLTAPRDAETALRAVQGAAPRAGSGEAETEPSSGPRLRRAPEESV
jgi:hypothetical protein